MSVWPWRLQCQGSLNAWLLYRGLVKGDIYQLGRATLGLLAKAALASALMAAVMWYFSPTIALSAAIAL